MATIDSSIAMGVRPVQIEDPLNKLAQVMQIQGMQRQGEAQDLQLQQQRSAIDRQNRLMQLLGGFQPNTTPEQQAAALTRGGFLPEAQSVTKTAAESSKVNREAEKARLESLMKKIEIGGQILGSVTDPVSYERARQVAAQAGFDPWPPQYDPAWVAQQAQQGMSLKDRAEQAWRATQDATTRRGQDLTASNARARLALDQQNAAQGVTYHTDEQGNIIALPTRLPAGSPAVGRVATDASGKPIMSGGKPLTDAQSKAALFGTRMQEANVIFDELEKQGTTTSIPGSRSGMGVGAVISALSPESQQRLDQAKRDFINAVLRRESGAVISDSEFANAEKQYFPQIGDSKEVIAQKKRNREIAQRGIMAEVPQGKRASLAAEISGRPATGAFSDAAKETRYQEWKRKQMGQ